MISFCTCVKNRIGNLQRLIESLSQMDCSEPFELVIADFASSDGAVERLTATFSVRVEQLQELYFNRSRGLNAAARAASGELLFFIDVDMLVPTDMLQQLRQQVRPGRCWFPVCYSLHQNKPPVCKDSSKFPGKANGWWRTEGAGMAAFLREDYAKVGEWDERLGETYGKEDTDICARAGRLMERSRDRCQGLFHVWHPTTYGYRSLHHKPRSVSPKKIVKVVKVVRVKKTSSRQPRLLSRKRR